MTFFQLNHMSDKKAIYLSWIFLIDFHSYIIISLIGSVVVWLFFGCRLYLGYDFKVKWSTIDVKIMDFFQYFN